MIDTREASFNRPAMLRLALFITVAGGLLLGGAGAAQEPVALPAASAAQQIYFSTGSGAIFAANLDNTSGKLSFEGAVATLHPPVALIASPHGALLYATDHAAAAGDTDRVLSFAIDTASGRLVPMSAVGSGGVGARAMWDDPLSHSLLVAHGGMGYGVRVLPIAKGGLLQPAFPLPMDGLATPAAPGLDGLVLDADGHSVLATDGQADRLLIYSYDPLSHRLAAAGMAALSVGSAPTELTFDQEGSVLFVAETGSGYIASFAWDAQKRRLKALRRVRVDAPTRTGMPAAIHLLVNPDGSRLYASAGLSRTIAVCAIAPGSGALTLIQQWRAGDEAPSGLALDRTGHWLIVAFRRSGKVSVVPVNPASGRLSAATATMSVPQPGAIVVQLHD